MTWSSDYSLMLDQRKVLLRCLSLEGRPARPSSGDVLQAYDMPAIVLRETGPLHLWNERSEGLVWRAAEGRRAATPIAARVHVLRTKDGARGLIDPLDECPPSRPPR